MKGFICGVALLLSFSCAFAQELPYDLVKDYHHVIRLIKENKADELSHLINYPLKRENPLPDITTPKQFVDYYPTLIDDAFRKRLQLYNDTDIFFHDGAYGLVGGAFNGDIWLSEQGKVTINYSSAKEQALKKQLTLQIQKSIYPAVNQWTENKLVLRCDKLLIRIDDTKQGLRYVSWSHRHSQAEKPDIIIYNGIEEARGTQGGWTWTFKNGDWTYVVDDVEMAERDAELGYFLRLSYKGVLRGTVKLREGK